jgi:hypothetical protein
MRPQDSRSRRGIHAEPVIDARVPSAKVPNIAIDFNNEQHNGLILKSLEVPWFQRLQKERLIQVRDREVGGSNPLALTIYPFCFH